MAVILTQSTRLAGGLRLTTGLPAGVLDYARHNSPQPPPAITKLGTNVPRAYVWTGTGPGNGDTSCTRYDVLCNADGTVKFNAFGQPMLDYTSATSAGSPTPPQARSLTVAGDTITINNWVGGARNGRWVTLPSLSITGLAAGVYYAVNASGNSCQLATTRGGAPLTLPGGGSSTSCTTRDSELQSLDHIVEGDGTFVSDSAGNARSLFLVLPMDEWGLNPQRDQPLQKPAGVYLQKGYHARVSGKIAFDYDWVALDGGVGFDVKGATPTVAHSGGGYHDTKQRAFRFADFAGTVDLRGVEVSGRYIYEVCDVSNGLRFGASVVGTGGMTVYSKFQAYHNKFGGPGGTGTGVVGGNYGQIRNLLVRSAASQSAMTDTANAPIYDVGDIINVASQKSWKYLGGDRGNIVNYQDLGTVNASGAFSGHSGGDCFQFWGTYECEIDLQYNEIHTRYQWCFLAWNDQLTSTSELAVVNAGICPRKITIGFNRVYGYGPAQSGYLFYITKAGIAGQTNVAQPPTYFPGVNLVSTEFNVPDSRYLVRLAGTNPTSGTATQVDSGMRFVEFSPAEKITYNIKQAVPRPVRFMA